MELKLTYFSFFFILLLISKANTTDPCASKSDGSDLSIIPIYSKCSPFTPPKPEPLINTIITMASKDPKRLKYLSTLTAQKTVSAPIASGEKILNIGNYVVRVQLGTPSQPAFMVLDTSNDAAWVPCSGCAGCTRAIFSPENSSTYTTLDCSKPQCAAARGLTCRAENSGECVFNETYGGDSSFSAGLVQDTLTFGSAAVPNYSFGCLRAAGGGSIPPQGLLGLGRGPLSLPSQTEGVFGGVFSYCLPSYKSYYFSGSLKLGQAGQPKSIRTTALLRSPHRPSLYYVNLTGISVGRVVVPIAPELLAFDPNSGAGTIIDSGTVITRFVPPIYTAIRDEFRKQVGGTFSPLGAFDTCFAVTNEMSAPSITFHLSGLDLKLPMENSLIHSSAGSQACLAMAAAPNNVNSVLNVIANLQQQNHRILFDVVNSKLGIARELCN